MTTVVRFKMCVGNGQCSFPGGKASVGVKLTTYLPTVAEFTDVRRKINGRQLLHRITRTYTATYHYEYWSLSGGCHEPRHAELRIEYYFLDFLTHFRRILGQCLKMKMWTRIVENDRTVILKTGGTR
jgi:hypothetical protein